MLSMSQQLSDHLLNLVLIARADGEMKPIEVLFLSRRRNAVTGSALTLSDAVIRSFSEQLSIPDTLIRSERVLHDMIVMSLIDGTTHEAEQQMVCEFIDACELPAHRVTSIIKSALMSIEHERAAIAVELQRYSLPL